MSAQELENRKGCNRRVIWFFVFAIACVAAFLIIGLVKTCTADHEEKEMEEIEQQEIVMNNPRFSNQFFS
ncbi:MAG: hypothetical protein J1F12_07840 [Muribaculaceae bacterium]|nr:hypothetical protein [Muribaculaceae bacterium]